uniref:transketolase n=1 Tax=Mucochytrium quahogii TaxID=96639 RepID=A0A7S2WU66_9STRA|mmetsp:Transcript_24364/g.39519  ORF Transcript_24364/g.39519 Transcript_24364/m.39519 type:complete len:691 (-) Transcript_24364:287-2359(-)
MGEPVAKRAKMSNKGLDKDCVNQIRMLSAEMVQQAKSGHPGAPMGCAPMAYALYTRIMKYNPLNPKWANRDRFVLSNGHGCALLYSMLHLTGYAQPTMEDIKNFRQFGSVTAGHPESHLLPSIEVTTGPLGQGISNAVGLALGQSHLASIFNEEGHEILDNYTYVICGDGCLQEGVSSEACSLAGHWKLGKLICLWDDNSITIDGDTTISFTEDVLKRYEAYGWQTLYVENGNDTDTDNLVKAIEEAKACTDKPTLIKVKTTIGIGSEKEGTAKVHGAPLGWDEIKRVRKNFGMDPDAHFTVPKEVEEHMRQQVQLGAEAEKEWDAKFAAYKTAFPEKAAEFERRMKGELPSGWADALPKFTPADKALATRQSSAMVLNAIADKIPEIIGGSADLTGSNLTNLKNSFSYQADSEKGRYLHFGVREHGMAAVCNGLQAYGGIIPFCATFLNFVGYALGAMRISALAEQQVLYIMTHDSIGLGEDGPTHQPIGIVTACRAIPNMYTFRPADANEVSGSYKCALELKNAPSVLCFTRQGLPNLEHSSIDGVSKGAYIIYPSEKKPAVTFVSTGSEVSICIKAAQLLEKSGIVASVVSMPCWKLFDKQSVEYKQSVFLEGVPVISVEALGTVGWEKYSHYQIGMTSFGASAPITALYDHFGFTPEKIEAKAKKVIKASSSRPFAWLVKPVIEDC